MKSYWGVDHGDAVSKAMPKMPTLGGLRQAGQNVRAGAAYAAGRVQSRLPGAKKAVRQAGTQAKAAGAYQAGRVKATPAKKIAGYGALTAGGVGAGAGGYALANRKKQV
jgi:hypothetical protein